MATQMKFNSIDEYVAGFPPEARAALAEVRAIIRETAPGATERMSYDMPTFDLNGHHLVHFAGWQKHIGFYPISAGIAAANQADLATLKQGKGSVQFPLGKPMPRDLIRRIVEARIREVGG